MVECDVCCHKRASVLPCGACGYKVCRPCARRCVADAPPDRPSCPSCGAAWDDRVLAARVGARHFATAVRGARREALLAAQGPLLPGTVDEAEREKRRRFLRGEIRRAIFSMRGEGFTDFQQHERLFDLRRALEALDNRPMAEADGRRRHDDVPCAWAGCPCPSVGQEGGCPLCGRATCTRCGKESLPGHACAEEELASLRAVREQSRPCAGCGAPSMRTEGCAIMWCLRCHSFWNWDSGTVIRRVTPHNPDHRDWLAGRQGGRREREAGDVPCGGVPEQGLIDRAIFGSFLGLRFGATLSVVPTHAPTILSASEAVHNAQEVVRRRYPIAREGDPYLATRVAYLVGDFASEASFAAALERKERGDAFKREVGLVLETFVHAGADALQRLCRGDDSIPKAAANLLAIREATREGLEEAGHKFGRMTPSFVGWGWDLPGRRRLL